MFSEHGDVSHCRGHASVWGGYSLSRPTSCLHLAEASSAHFIHMGRFRLSWSGSFLGFLDRCHFFILGAVPSVGGPFCLRPILLEITFFKVRKAFFVFRNSLLFVSLLCSRRSVEVSGRFGASIKATLLLDFFYLCLPMGSSMRRSIRLVHMGSPAIGADPPRIPSAGVKRLFMMMPISSPRQLL